MGKNQHSKDRMFLTATEWKELGGRREGSTKTYRPLPFDCCALSLQPFETPVCTPEGVIFDILNIIPYIQKHKKSPITGQPLTTKDILRLNMAKNSEDKWHCPVTFKEFNDNTHVVAIKPSGNVYAMDAVQELNIKRKNWTDLMTGEPFTRKDIITLQDPSNPEHMALRDISNFKHLQELRDEESAKQAGADQASNIRTNASTEVVLKEFHRQKREREEEDAEKRAKEAEEERAGSKRPKILVEDLHPGKHVTTGKAAASFTATGLDLATDAQCREATEQEVQEARWKVLRKVGKKGYVQLQTNLGNLNLEIHADFVPRTAENFLTLCARGAYDGLTFHRVVKGFMIQGGDPTGTGRGGESCWGKDPFKDEFDSRLVHDQRGLLSMANSGPDTNRSQFFITFKSCRHLDNVHSIFGRVVGGAQTTLARMEEVETDKNDKPVQEIKIIKAVVFDPNPVVEAEKAFDEMIAERQRAREEREAARKAGSALNPGRVAPKGAEDEDADRIGFYSMPGPVASSSSTGVGKYLASGSKTTLSKLPAKPQQAPAASVAPSEPGQAVQKRKGVAGTQFKDFSSW